MDVAIYNVFSSTLFPGLTLLLSANFLFGGMNSQKSLYCVSKITVCRRFFFTFTARFLWQIRGGWTINNYLIYMIWHHFVEITITFLTLRFLKKRRKNPCVFVYLLLFFITEQRYLVTLVYGSLQKRQNSPETPVIFTKFSLHLHHISSDFICL